MKYKIHLSMEDCDISKETVCLYVDTKTSLKSVVKQINQDFAKYDIADGVAENFREGYGWGTEGFIEYLKYQHKDWKIITLDFSPDAVINLVGR